MCKTTSGIFRIIKSVSRAGSKGDKGNERMRCAAGRRREREREEWKMEE